MKKCKLLVINKLGSRTYSLDLLRIIEIMMVLFIHTNLFGDFLKINNKCMVFKIKVYIFFNSTKFDMDNNVLDCGYVISRGTTWRTNNISGYS